MNIIHLAMHSWQLLHRLGLQNPQNIILGGPRHAIFRNKCDMKNIVKISDVQKLKSKSKK